jgi:protoporphyrinogen oxidase
VERDPAGGVAVSFGAGQKERFDEVVLTAPAPAVADLVPALPASEADFFRGVEYQGIVCASLLLRRPLGPYYVTNITETWVPFTGVIEMTTLVDPAELGGLSLVYLPKYVDPADPAFALSDEDLRERFVSALERMYPHFRREDMVAFRVSRVRRVFALSTLGYSRRLPPMTTSVPGVHVVNSAHILNGTLNVNETVQLAEKAAALLRERRPAREAA